MQIPQEKKYTLRLYYLSMKNGPLQEAMEELLKSEDDVETLRTNRETFSVSSC